MSHTFTVFTLAYSELLIRKVPSYGIKSAARKTNQHVKLAVRTTTLQWKPCHRLLPHSNKVEIVVLEQTMNVILDFARPENYAKCLR